MVTDGFGVVIRYWSQAHRLVLEYHSRTLRTINCSFPVVELALKVVSNKVRVRIGDEGRRVIR